ncbi:hypothetical protein STTU_4899 [Streptomyces sp. Tu6071]|uniref:DUF7426 family protein n=1 Tax=Streptomyces sp. Tu6071 TaxID=355249 RepID=UPI00020E5FE7|nr:hypothetical protein [Streptomyces sp. Tu6071]EGJ77688.1 hypothetical protein STTU_4899 [Streptomyces sp. Tu6071]
MAQVFEALDTFLDDALELPVRGTDGVERTYRIPSPSAEDGLRVEKITRAAARMLQDGTEPDAESLSDDEERDLYRMLLGPVHDELLAATDWARFKHTALTVMFWVTADLDTARTYWASGGDPSQLAPNRAARRQAARGSSESAAASTTRSRGSTSGTRAASPRSGKAKAAPRK